MKQQSVIAALDGYTKDLLSQPAPKNERLVELIEELSPRVRPRLRKHLARRLSDGLSRSPRAEVPLRRCEAYQATLLVAALVSAGLALFERRIGAGVCLLASGLLLAVSQFLTNRLKVRRGRHLQVSGKARELFALAVCYPSVRRYVAGLNLWAPSRHVVDLEIGRALAQWDEAHSPLDEAANMRRYAHWLPQRMRFGAGWEGRRGVPVGNCLTLPLWERSE